MPTMATSVSKTLVLSTGGQSYYRPEFVTIPGPALVGTPGGSAYSDLYGSDWVVYLNEDGERKLGKIVSGVLTDYTSDLLIDFDNKTHVSASFDAADSELAVAWQDGASVYVSQYVDPSMLTRGPFTGYDPVMLYDGETVQDIAGANMHLVYLNAARTDIVYRTDADNYATEKNLIDLTTLGLTSPFYLLDVAYGDGRYNLALSDATGTVFNLESDEYGIEDFEDTDIGELPTNWQPIGASYVGSPGDWGTTEVVGTVIVGGDSQPPIYGAKSLFGQIVNYEDMSAIRNNGVTLTDCVISSYFKLIDAYPHLSRNMGAGLAGRVTDSLGSKFGVAGYVNRNGGVGIRDSATLLNSTTMTAPTIGTIYWNELTLSGTSATYRVYNEAKDTMLVELTATIVTNTQAGPPAVVVYSAPYSYLAVMHDNFRAQAI